MVGYLLNAQIATENYRTKRLVVKDTMVVDSVSINPTRFKLTTRTGQPIDSTLYRVDFAKGLIILEKGIIEDSLDVAYLRYPLFITKTYQQLDESLIVNNASGGLQQLYKIQRAPSKKAFTPFEGLTTSGSISRAVTVGNNQNSVLNSELDLQISGNLSEKVTLRASIQDANIPLQETGYSQQLDEFDQVFIELISEDWNIRAGDIDLVNNNSYYANFTKRVQGLYVNANLSEATSVYASGALVRGQWTTTQFVAQEGNQGPYKIFGPNNEVNVLIVSGSETIYVNGIPLIRGENRDYIIDYNAGEIIFNSTYPITSEMRITVDYQFTERNYSRFTIFGGGSYKKENFNVNVAIFSESDAKNQPLQQDLTQEQAQILAEAGDDRSQMIAPSDRPTEFSENRILYRKELLGTEEIFVFSNDPEDDLFSVTFTNIGPNNGDYILANINAINNIYEYIAPIDGVSQGNFAPVIQLVAPERLQVAILNAEYQPSEKTDIFVELAASRNDLNLFSDLDNGDNDGFATKLRWNQILFKKDSAWNVSALVDTDFIQNDFRTVQRLYRPEFNRDWNLDDPLGNQLLLTTGVDVFHQQKGRINYSFEYLDYSENYNGNRHNLTANLRLGNFSIFSKSSTMNNESSLNEAEFTRSFNRVVYGKGKVWAGAKIALEDNIQEEKETGILSSLSQRFVSYEAFAGVGDSTKVFAEVGYIRRNNDSLRSNEVKRVNTSNTYYLKSRLVQTRNSNLQLFVNFRDLKAKDELSADEQSLNSRLNYNQRFAKNVLIWNINFETNSGTQPQQEFTYVEVEPGQGAYTWIDYNNNGVQELDEFELAQFQDQGEYIRVLLPNQIFVPTHQNRLSQTLTFNPSQWAKEENKTKRFWSHFYNQTAFLVDRRILREPNDFDLSPIDDGDDNTLGLNNNFRNVLFYNRGKQRYTTSYTFLSNRSRNLLSVGFQENKLVSHQFSFIHKFAQSWLLNTQVNFDLSESISENFNNRNFELNNQRFLPKLSYIFNENAQFDVFYQYSSKENQVADLEQLQQNNFGVSFTYNNPKAIALIGEFNYFDNDFTGNPNSPVAYQMLEGLQPGNNFTWSLLAQKRLTKFLDLNINYLGRKTENSK
ncbi:MAG: hypothetical protein AAGH46_02375, partial [Bacteroidota bacterium]